MSDTPAKNTDKEIWRKVEGDYYSPRIHVTEGGSIGIDVGGYVIVRTVEQWHSLERELAKEQRIVDRVWAALGIKDYLQAGGKTIDEIVTDRMRQLAEFKEMYAKEAHAKMVLLEQLAGARKDVIEECIALVQTWFDAYPTNHNSDAMGRHMAGQIMKQMRELSSGQVLDNGQK
jgi:hypothetical protein